MIQLSARYAWPVALLALLTAVPVALHTNGRLDRDDCFDPGLMRAVGLIPNTAARMEQRANSRQTLVRRIFPWRRTIQDTRGQVEAGLVQSPPMLFGVMRVFDSSRIVEKPTQVFLKSFEASGTELRWIERDGERLPVHWSDGVGESRASFSAHYFIYGGRPVERPVLAVLASGGERLLRGSRPLSLISVGGVFHPGEEDRAVEAAETWLIDSWKHYQLSCEPRAQSAGPN